MTRVHALTLVSIIAIASAAPAHAQTAPANTTPRLGGFIQLRETYQDPTGLSATVHRARLMVDGSLGSEFRFRVSSDFRSGGTATSRAGVSLTDAYIEWSRTHWAVRAGQFKTPFTREYLLQPIAIETPDRAAPVESLAPKRDIGVMATYARGPGTIALGVFNGEGVNTVANVDSTVLVVGRATARLPQAVEAGFNMAMYGGDSTRYGIDAAVQRGRVSARAEFIGQHRSGSSADDHGWYVLAAYRLNAWAQLVARQEDLRRPAAGTRNDATTVGTIFDFSDNRVRLYLDYVSRRSGTPAVRHGTFLAQLQVRF